jgi:hypothetical protein
MLKLERRHQALLPRGEFLRRQAVFSAAALGLVGFSLFLGMAGYHWLERLSWLDSLLNASMLLGGMGPLAPIQSDAGKYFASFYALFSGMVFLVSFSMLITPLAHRLFHRFHLDEDPLERRKKRRKAA